MDFVYLKRKVQEKDHSAESAVVMHYHVPFLMI